MLTPELLEGIRKRRHDIYDVAQHVRIHPEIPRRNLLEMFATDIDALLAEVERLRGWATFTRAYAHRTRPHASGQGHLALMGVEAQMVKALNGDEVFER